MVNVHRAIGIDVHQRARLIEMGEGEGDAEFDGRQRNALAQETALRVERLHRFATCAIVGGLLELGDDIGDDVVFDAHAVGRDIAALGVEITLAHVERIHAELNGDCVHHALGHDHALRTSEAPEGGVGDGVGAEAPRTDPEGGIVVGIIRVEHGAVVDAEGEIGRVAAA